MKTTARRSKPASLGAAPSCDICSSLLAQAFVWPCSVSDWGTGVAESRSFSFCPFPFKFLSVSKIFDIHVSNGLKLLSSSGHCVISS